MQDRPVLVSTSSKGREDYNKAQLALIKSTHDHKLRLTHDYMMRSVDGYCDNYYGIPIKLGSWPVTDKYGTAWQHADMPYQFKPFAIQEAIESGYTRVLWCDSTIRLMANPEPLWEQCATNGILAWDNEGHPLDKWIAPHAAEAIGIDPKGVKQIMACCIMFDFSHPITQVVFDEWIECSRNGSFLSKGFNNHRHDQACLSAILHKHNVPIQPYGALAYPHYTPVKPIFLNWGVPA
jgi:hypothetical protein